MNNSELFKKAHKLARKNVTKIGDYRLAFKWALAEVKAEAEKPSPKKSKIFVNNVCRIIDNTINDLLALGLLASVAFLFTLIYAAFYCNGFTVAAILVGSVGVFSLFVTVKIVIKDRAEHRSATKLIYS